MNTETNHTDAQVDEQTDTLAAQTERPREKIITLDFDGVIHGYQQGWQGADHAPDPPVQGAREFIEAALDDDRFKLAIHSSRSHQPGGIDEMQRYLRDELQLTADQIKQIEFPEHKPPATVTIDDRGIPFYGEWPSLEAIDQFRPWNKGWSGDHLEPNSEAMNQWSREAHTVIKEWLKTHHAGKLIATASPLIETAKELVNYTPTPGEPQARWDLPAVIATVTEWAATARYDIEGHVKHLMDKKRDEDRTREKAQEWIHTFVGYLATSTREDDEDMAELTLQEAARHATLIHAEVMEGRGTSEPEWVTDPKTIAQQYHAGAFDKLCHIDHTDAETAGGAEE